MGAIGVRRLSFSVTKSGRMKSCALSCVSRTRFRRARERRKRRGRCPNLLTSETYPFDGNAASLTGRSVPCSAWLAIRYEASGPDSHDRLFASRYQQLVYEVCICIDKADFGSGSDRHQQTFEHSILALLETAKGSPRGGLSGRAKETFCNLESCRKNWTGLVGFDIETRARDALSPSELTLTQPPAAP